MLFNQVFLGTCQFQCFSNFSSTSYLQLNSLLERTVRRLDEDARRTGRISMKEIQEALREIQQSSEFSNFELLTYLFSSRAYVKFYYLSRIKRRPTLFLANVMRLHHLSVLQKIRY